MPDVNSTPAPLAARLAVNVRVLKARIRKAFATPAATPPRRTLNG